MPPKTAVIEKLLEVNSRKELLENPANWWAGLTLPQTQKLTRHIQTFELEPQEFRIGIIHTYTSDLLEPWFEFHAAVQNVKLATYHAPYGMNLMEAQANSGLQQHEPDLTVFMLRREDLHPEFNKPITGLSNEHQDTLSEEAVSRLLNILSQFRANISGRFIVSILPSFFTPGLGLYDMQSNQSESAWWDQLKRSLTHKIATQLESTLYLDLDQLLAEKGRDNFFDLRFWYTSRFPFKPQTANEFARKILDVASLTLTPKVKVIVLDADNTLWGGVIGEDGLNGISLGQDYPGNAFMDFQRRILDYQERGFILAICSKNNHQDVIEVLQNHPHQILKESHFAAMRINWQPKHENLKSLAEELNLGLDSFVFVDDSDYECGMVRRELPQVHVVQTPSKPTGIPGCLENISRLEILNLTQEDKQKTRLYAEERKRREHHKEVDVSGGGIDEYLLSLKMKMEIELNSSGRISRLAQLTQKTNQFNLTTRRYREQQIQEFVDSDQWLVASFTLNDSFGDSGVVGLALINYQDSSQATIDTFLMSCRVIGRKAESAFLEALMKRLSEQRFESVNAEFIPSLKNQLVENFYSEQNFTKSEENKYSRSLEKSPYLSFDNFPIDIVFCKNE